MKTLKYALILAAAALAAPSAQASMVDFHFGATTQTGAAAFGSTGDIWNSSNVGKAGPILLKDVTGQPTSVSASWTSGDAWVATGQITSGAIPSLMDPATTGLMTSFADSYAYGTGIATNLSLSLTGLAHNQAYSLVLYGAGNQINEGSQFTVYGASTYTGSTSGVSRKISKGPGVAYVVIPVVTSSTGTLRVNVAKGNYNWATLNGFQLMEGAVTTPVASTAATASTPAATPATPATTSTPVVSTPNVTSASMASTTTTTTTAPATTSASTLTPLIWGVSGHPTWSNYASWIPANVTTQMNDLNAVGAGYYRVTFEGATYPSYLDTVAPKAKTAGITLLPVLPISLVAASSAQVNYSTNYTIGYNFATYAIAKGYNIPAWELGNEVENDDLVDVVYDGTHAADFPDHKAGGFVAIANGLNGAYQGIKDAYTAGRAAHTTTVTPQVLIGMCYRHWGLLANSGLR